MRNRKKQREAAKIRKGEDILERCNEFGGAHGGRIKDLTAYNAVVVMRSGNKENVVY